MSLSLKEKVAQLPSKPGVYRMRDDKNRILYVGKAKDLKKRVSSYFRSHLQDKKTAALMERVVDFDVTITSNENQALLLESNLIKELRPRYNVLLRDDKAYPYLFLSTNHDFPRLDFCRGKKREKGRYFGPYPNIGAVRDNLALIQKLFKLRQCRDAFFRHRTRPCLQYQINRCTAPCVGKVTKAQYHEQVLDAIAFLEGKNDKVIELITRRMNNASESQDYEAAANARDLLIRLRHLQRQQTITDGQGNIDIFGAAEKMGVIAIAVVAIRGGQLLGHQTYFPNLPEGTSTQEALSAFIPQYYLAPEHVELVLDRIVVTEPLADRQWLENALSECMKKSVQVTDRKTKKTSQWQVIAISNATESLERKLAEKTLYRSQLEALQQVVALPSLPKRIECFDISHTSGVATKASCVVFGLEGAMRKSYRQFDIKDVTPGDDYAAMLQVITRRYLRLKKTDAPLPDLIIIDGGKGQLKQAEKAMEALQISGVTLLGVAKGPARKAGLETLIISGGNQSLNLASSHKALHLIAQIRDEAHRFAITAHRKKRTKQGIQSKLLLIPGVGKNRRQLLLQHFGGYAELKKASLSEIAQVKGISVALAQLIYNALHES